MNNIFGRFVHYIYSKNKVWRAVISVLSAFIVFTTTYALILPAITLDSVVASEDPAISIAEDTDEDVYIEEEEPVYTEDSSETFEGEGGEIVSDETDENTDADVWVETDENVEANDSQYPENGADTETAAAPEANAEVEGEEEVGIISEDEADENALGENGQVSELTFDENGISAVMTFDAPAFLNEGTKLSVSEILRADDEAYFDGYANSVNDQLAAAGLLKANDVRLFAITVADSIDVIDPEVASTIKMTFANSETAGAGLAAYAFGFYPGGVDEFDNAAALVNDAGVFTTSDGDEVSGYTWKTEHYDYEVIAVGLAAEQQWTEEETEIEENEEVQSVEPEAQEEVTEEAEAPAAEEAEEAQSVAPAEEVAAPEENEEAQSVIPAEEAAAPEENEEAQSVAPAEEVAAPEENEEAQSVAPAENIAAPEENEDAQSVVPVEEVADAENEEAQSVVPAEEMAEVVDEEAADAMSHVFNGIDDSITLSALMSECGIFDIPLRLTLSDADAVKVSGTLTRTLTAVKYFEEVTLTVRGLFGSYEIMLSNPAQTVDYEAGEELTARDGAPVTIKLLEGVSLPSGAFLSVESPEDIEALKQYVIDQFNGVVPTLQFFDIKIDSEEGEVHDVNAEVTLDDLNWELPENATAENVNMFVFHFSENGVDEIEATPVVEDGVITGATFETEGFSVFGVGYTVDFETVNGGKYSIPGSSSIALSDLLHAIGLDVSVEDVTAVEFSDPNLIAVSKVTEDTLIETSAAEVGVGEYVVYAGDWLLTSLAPFSSHEILTITTTDGTKYSINVTDAQFTSNLGDLLTDIYIKIDGNKVPDGSTITIEEGQTFDVHMEFTENDFLQLPEDNSTMTFSLPEGINLGDQAFSRKIEVDLGLDGKVKGNTLSYDPVTNSLSFTWNRRDPKFRRLIAADNTKLVFDVTGQFDSDATHVDFGSGYDITVNQTEPKDANVTKNGQLFLPGAADNPFGNQPAIKYTVTVTSEGATTVNVNDHVDGSAVTLVTTQGGNTGWSATSNKGTTITPSFNSKGFSLNGQSLQDGEVVKITYWGTIDTSGIENLQNVSYQQTGNKVTLTGEGIPDKEDSHFEHEVGTNGISKSTTGVESVDEYGKQVVHWKVVVNDPPMEALGGSTFTDRIASASLAYMDYDTSKNISILVKDANGNTVGTPRTVAWSDLSTVSESYDKHWTYTFPAGDTTAYIYEFTYDTVVDTTKYNNGNGGYFSVMNESEGKPGKDTGTATVGEPEGETPPPPIQYTKKATNVNEETITWNISINIDQNNNGYNPFVVTEYLPHIGWNSVGYVDDLVSISVTGLQGTEWYSLEMGKNPAISGNNYVSTGADKKDSMVTLTFYQDGAVDGDRTNANSQNSTDHPGLKADTSRTLNIQVVTANDPNWMQLGADHYTDANAPWHKNETKVNNYEVAHDTVKPMKKTVLKLRDGNSNVTNAATATAFKTVEFSTDHGKATDETHKEYPAVKYWVLVGGITDANLENGNQIIITDKFDSHFRLMGVDHDSSDGLENDKRPLLYGTSVTGSTGTQLDETTMSWTQTADGTATFIITNPPKNGDNYYPYYLVQYWLVAKSEEDFNAIKMEALNNDGLAQFENIATSDDISDELDFTYNYSVIDKSSVADTSGSLTLLKYTIEINKDCLTLNNGTTMTMTDTYSSNLSIDFGTVEVLTAVDKNGIDRTNEVTWDFRSHVGTYTIPDETHIKIQYFARPIGDAGSIQTVTNTAYMEGYYDTETKDQMVDMSGGGSAEVVRIRLLKFGADHMEEGLNGAVFRLMDQDRNVLKTFTTAETGFVNKYGVLHAGNDPLDYEYVVVDEDTSNYIVNVNSNYLTADAQARLNAGTLKTRITPDDFGECETWEEYLVQYADTLVCYNDLTDAGLSALGITRHAGFAEIMMDQSTDGMALKKERVYYLQEIIAPPGYELDTTLYSFLISDQSNYAAPAGVYVYHNNDVLTVRNWPEETPVLKLQKTFTGNVELTDEQKNAVTFQIQKKVDGDWTEYTVPVWRDGSKQDVSTFTYGDYGVIEDTSTTPSTYSQGDLLFKDGVMVIENLSAGEYRVIESNQAMGKPGGGNYDRRTEYLVDGSTVRVNDDIISYDSATGTETKISDNEANGVVFSTDGTSSHFVSITNTYFIEEFTLTKTASDTGELLGNAKFAIYSRTDSNTETLIKDNIATDANGKIEIQKTGNSWDSSITFAEDTLYYIVETEAPAGYITPGSPDKYYFYFSSEGSTFNPNSLLPTGETAVDLSTGFGTARVSNNRDSEKTYVNVKKTWVNSLGQDITDSMTDTEGVSVTLNRTTAKPNAGKAITTVGIEEIEADLANLHTLTFTNSNANQSSRVYFLAGDKLQISIYGTDLTGVNAPSSSAALTNVATTKAMMSWTATAPNSDLTVTIDNDAVTGISVSNVTAANRSYVLTEAEAEILGGEAVTPDGTVTLDTQNNWAHTFSNLPVADDSGNLYFYYITEPESTAQSTSIGISGKEITVTNTAPDQLEVNKKWEDYEGNSVNAEKTDGSITYELYQVENPLVFGPYSATGTIGVDFSSFKRWEYWHEVAMPAPTGHVNGTIKEGSKVQIVISTTDSSNSPLTNYPVGSNLNITGGNLESDVISNSSPYTRTITLTDVNSTIKINGTINASGAEPSISVTVLEEPTTSSVELSELVQNKMGEVVVTYDNATLTKASAFSTSSVRVSPGTKPWSSLIYNLDSKGAGTGDNAGQRVNYTYYVVETPSPVATNYDPATYQVDGQNVAIANGNAGDTIVIINKENQPPYGSLSITKAIQTGSPDASGKTFTFEVELKNADNSSYTENVKVQDSTRTTAADVAAANGKITVTVTGTGTAVISEIPVGTTYAVTEPTENLPTGWSQEGTVTYSDSTKSIAANDADTATVTNKYKATGTLDFSAAKTFTNGTLGDTQFSFKLTQVTAENSTTAATSADVGTEEGNIPALKLSAAETKTTGATSGNTDTVNFTQMTFTKNSTVDETGEYWFLLEEVIPDDAKNAEGKTYAAATDAEKADGGFIKDGIKYDTTPTGIKWIKVTVADNGEGALTVTKDPNPNEGDPDGTWTNEQLGSLDITKNIQTNGTTDPSKTGTFYYAVYTADNVETGAPKSGAEPVRTGSIEVTESGTKTVTEADLPYGTYYVFELTDNNGTPIVSGDNGTVQKIGTTVYKVTGSGTTAIVGDTAEESDVSDSSGTNSEETNDGTNESETSSNNVTINNSVETIKAKVHKEWSDSNSTKRPTSLTVTLYAHSGTDESPVETQKTQVTLNSGNNWTSEVISDLPAYDENGHEIAYHWVEGSLPAGYFLTNTQTSKSETDGVITTTLTNTLQNYDLQTSYTGVKTWDDNSNGWDTRPARFVVTLYKIEQSGGTYASTGTALAGVEPTWAYDAATNQWTYTFENLPVFDDNGNVIKYYAKETVPGGYTQESETNTPTTWSMGTITYEDGRKRITPDNQLVWTLGSLIDLSFVAIKPTANGAVPVWTHRIPTPAEEQAIRDAIRGGALPGCSGRNVQFYSGTGSITLPHGTVTVVQDGLTVTLDMHDPNIWSQFIVGQFNQNGSSAYDIGTTNFTNKLEETTLSGTKTWKLSGNQTIDNAENITLKLTRTTTVDEVTSTPEIIYAKSAAEKTVYSSTATTQLLQPTWTGNSYTYYKLPEKDGNGNTYAYSVAEWQFKVGEFTYSVDANGKVTKSNSSAPDIKVTQSGNDFTNSEITTVSVTKEWKNRDNTTTPPTNAEVTFDLYQNGTKVDGKSITLDGAALTSADASAATYGEFAEWVATWKNLDAVDAEGNTYTYTVKEDGGGWQHYTVSYPLSDPNDSGSNPKDSASDGETITNTETTTDLEVDKQWFANQVNATAGTPEKIPTITTIYYKIMQKLGNADATVYTYNDKTVQSLTYTPGKNDELGDWTTVTHTGLPKKVYVADTTTPENSAWVDATYYVVECAENGDALSDVDYADTYKKNEGSAGLAADAVVSANDTNRKITIINTDSNTSLTVEKSWKLTNENLDMSKVASYQITYKVQQSEDGTTWEDYDSSDEGTEADTYTMTWTAAAAPATEPTITNNIVSELQAGYKYRAVETYYEIVLKTGESSTQTITSDVTVEGTSVENDSAYTSVLENTLTDFNFQKRWKNASGQNVWPQENDSDLPITVTLGRKIDSTEDSEFTATFIVTSSGGTESDSNTGIVLTRTSDDTVFQFQAQYLPKSGIITVDGGENVEGEYTYYISEQQLDAYQPVRYFESSTAESKLDGANSTGDDGVIENEIITVSLPETGGSGTTPYTLGGSLILAFTALAYIFKKKRRLSLVPVEDESPWRGGGPRK